MIRSSLTTIGCIIATVQKNRDRNALRWMPRESGKAPKLRREDFPRYAQSAIDEGMLVSGRLKDRARAKT
jgi:hypothetical protein